MIALFRNNLFVNSLLLLPYIVLVRVNSFINPVGYIVTEDNALLSKYIFDLISSPLMQSIVAVIVIFFQATAINRLSIKNRIANNISLLPGVGYILLVGFLPDYLYLSPALLANSFIIWAASELYAIYKKAFTTINLFNTGLAIGIASLLVPSLSVFLIFGLIGLMIIKSFNIIDALQIIIGYLCFIYLFYSIVYISGSDISSQFSKFILSTNFGSFVAFNSYLSIFLIVLSISVFTILGYNSYMVKKSIQVQKKIDLLFWAMLCALLASLFAGYLEPSLVVILFVPASLLLNMNFQSIKSNPIAEIIHIGILSLLFATHFNLL